MITPEEIKKLSEECALHYQGRPSNKGYELSNRLTIESYALMTLKWLSERFCIVPKEQVYMRLGVANALMEQDPAHREFYRGMSSVLVSIFGKDMFEEEGK